MKEGDEALWPRTSSWSLWSEVSSCLHEPTRQLLQKLVAPSVSDEMLFQLDAPLSQLFNITANEESASYGDNRMHFTLLDWKNVAPGQLVLLGCRQEEGWSSHLSEEMCISLVC